MSGVSEELGRKIGGAQDLQSIVRSMKALAASNIGQYERAVAALLNSRCARAAGW
jgi:F-type H+-transporting ATPase subunit gamma